MRASIKSPSMVSTSKTEPFYLGVKDNAKGMAFRSSSKPTRPLTKIVPIVAITDKEENITTKDVRQPAFIFLR